MLQKLTMKNMSSRYGIAIATVLSAFSLVLALGQYTLGYLIGTLGLTYQAAVVIVTIIASGGIYTAAVLYPILVPFIATIQGIILVAGTAAVVGF